MAKKQVEHDFSLSQEQFWGGVFLEPVYTERVFIEGLGCDTFELLGESGSVESVYERRMRASVKIAAPKPLQKLLGSEVTYIEAGTFRSDSMSYSFNIETEVLGDKLAVSGDLRSVDRADNGVRTTFCVEANASIFGIGKILEQFIVVTYIELQKRCNRFTDTWIRENSL